MKLFSVVITFCFASILLTSCGADDANSQKEPKSYDELATVPPHWIEERVSNAKEHLNSTEAGKVVWNAMEAHGGLEQWYSNGPVKFHFNYCPVNGSTPRNTYAVMNTWSSKARHLKAEDITQQFGWDGQRYWIKATDTNAFAYNTKFWSLTPYYFVAQPFALDGDGVNLELLPQKAYKDATYEVVKVTFEDGTGDAPDDYYILYFNMNDHKLGVIRYIVSYPGYHEDGGHSPEKFMELYGEQVVNGIVFPESYQTHMLADDDTPGEHVTNVTLSEITFLPDLQASYFDMPDGAVLSNEP